MYDRLTIRSIFREYAVHFVDDAFHEVKDRFGEDTFFIIDKTLKTFYPTVFDSGISEERIIYVEACELNKSIDYCQELIKLLINRNIRKNYKLVAIGGGILQDITAFTASILFRGIEWNFMPTTLLAQADSCIGSKTSINLTGYKNIIGNFYPPQMVFIDVKLLKTLSKDDIKSGIGEILHYYLIDDSPMTHSLISSYDELLETPESLNVHIKESLSIKKKVIERDEFDRNERNIFNYGHTFGHALETLTDYAMRHGQAVTIGMDLANYLSTELGYMTTDIYQDVHNLLKKNMPVLNFSKYNIENYFKALMKDKKNIGKNLVCILSHKPGDMFKTSISFDKSLRKTISHYFKKYY